VGGGGDLNSGKGSDSIHKALGLLTLFETYPVLSVARVVQLAGLPKATVIRLLAVLTEHRLIARTPDRSYQLGLRCLQLGTCVAERLDVRRVALPHMHHLRDLTGQSVQLAVIQGDEGVFVERCEGTTAVRLYLAVGKHAPLYAGASTRLLLAYCSPGRQAEILAAHPPVRYTPTTVVDPDQLRQLMDETRVHGWTVSRGELQPGSAEMAAPLFGHRREVIAALSIAGPDELYGPGSMREYLPHLRKTAAAISREMGYTDGEGVRHERSG
jgi:IclR family KDG regulon transcriptional repressor